jgi:hypothetical protein
MASGVNSTFRQIGIATGIAALGSIFATHVHDGIRSSLAGTPAAGRAGQVADAVTNGQIGAVLARTPAAARGAISQAATKSFVDALNHITLLAALIAFAAGIFCLFLIRARDFEGHHGAGSPRPKGGRHRAERRRPDRNRAEPAPVG